MFYARALGARERSGFGETGISNTKDLYQLEDRTSGLVFFWPCNDMGFANDVFFLGRIGILI